MTPIALQKLRDQNDARWAAILYWLQQGGQEKLKNFLVSKSGNRDRATDLYGQVVTYIYEATSSSVDDAVKLCYSGDTSELESLAITRAKQILSPKSSVNRKDEAFSSNTVDLEKHSWGLADERAERLGESLEIADRRNLFVDALRHALTDRQREELLLVQFHGKSIAELSREAGCSHEAVRKRHEKSLKKLATFVEATQAGERCPEISATFVAVVDNQAVDDRALIAARDHAKHCAACRQVLADGRRRLNGAALALPFPAIVVCSDQSVSTGILETIKGIWAWISNKSVEFATPVASSPAGQGGIRPGVAVGAVVLVVAGGGSAYKVVSGGEEAPKKTAPAETFKPQPRLFDAIPQAPTPKPKKKAEKKAEPAAPQPAAPAPAPVQVPSAGGTDDGSSEFTPEGR